MHGFSDRKFSILKLSLQSKFTEISYSLWLENWLAIKENIKYSSAFSSVPERYVQVSPRCTVSGMHVDLVFDLKWDQHFFVHIKTVFCNLSVYQLWEQPYYHHSYSPIH